MSFVRIGMPYSAYRTWGEENIPPFLQLLPQRFSVCLPICAGR